ncbi:wsc domain-containing [Pyrenophora seminiperda CCB06]|uniref:Wsc domain-containing n=1 Tax=Pyrenophora seminiperda CCB06 TaxID=1302712 RepID=A0A3M7M753_9PLEO|nr:wsc domain-containing [Pyrenophora seminiperda CCB06]
MVYMRLATALAVASMAMVAVADNSDSPTKIKNPITTPTVTVPANAMTSIGCFATGTPLENHGPYNFQSPGNCQLVCLQLGKDVMGLSDGVDCWCGDEIPASQWQTKNETCGTTCAGDDTSGCGGKGALWVVLTGKTRNPVDYFSIPVSSSSSTAAPSSTTVASSTAVASATPSATPSPAPKSDPPNTVAIAVGVVVGILALAAIVFGVWFFLRRKRQHQAEEDYRRNAANVNNFVNGGKLHTSNSSMNDSRLDPSFVDRRQSNGSIADNEDYSRRILKVTNV